MPSVNQLGIVAFALNLHRRHRWAGRHTGLTAAAAFIEECARFRAGGVQIAIEPADADSARDIRERTERHGMILEAILSPPRDESDIPRFEAGLKLAMAAGATLARTVIMPGRRYEQFHDLNEFRDAAARGRRMLELAEPILARHRFRLAVENHKDQRTDERLELFRHLSSEYIGACVDLGNSFALLEDFTETTRAFAPWAMTVHIKDQAVRPYDEGFLYADVALGDGIIDLPAQVRILREARPDIRFYLETITRDALRVPVLRREYWATMGDAPARDLARTWAMVMREAHPTPFVEVSKLEPAGQLALEDQHVSRSFAWAREHL